MTDNGSRLISNVLLTQYAGGFESADEIYAYAWEVVGGFSSHEAGAGTLARAIEAGLVHFQRDGEDSVVSLTEKGWAQYAAKHAPGACFADDYQSFTDLAVSVLESLDRA